MALTKEADIINHLATEFAKIDGIKTTFGFAQNPDALKQAQLPAVVFIPESFKSGLRAHHNRHQNELNITGILFVAPRESRGGKLKFIENATIPFMYSVRKHFQTESVMKGMLALGGLTQAGIVSGEYGVGGNYLNYSGIEHIGLIFRWTFIEIN
jgi:hypothetical protein